MLVVENKRRRKITVRADGLLPISSSYLLYPGDLQDGKRVCMVFRNGIKTGRSKTKIYVKGCIAVNERNESAKTLTG